jgi:AraC-like DNA-binding protein
MTGSRWEWVSGQPAPPLRGAVTRYQGYAERAAGPVRRWEGPSLGVVLIINLGPRLRVGADWHTSFVAGLGDTAAETEHAGEQRGLQVDLDPLTARALFGVPMHLLAGRAVSLEDVLGAQGRELVERLADAPDWAARFPLLDAALARRLAEHAGPSPLIRRAWSQLREHRGRVRVEALADELGCSRRHLTRSFREDVGLPPKTIARILRFQQVTAGLRAGRPLADLAERAGYADQPHLNRDFRDLAGCTPTEYVATRLS